MTDPVIAPALPEITAHAERETLSAMKEITGAQAEITAAVSGAQESHLAMCQALLSSALDAASIDLPEVERRLTSRVASLDL